MLRVKKLDWYVASSFAGPFLLCLGGLVGLFVVIDFFSNIDDFLAHDSMLAILRLVFSYYLLRTPSFIVQVTPILTVAPAVICVIRLERSNELNAMRVSGLSARRISAPLIACAIGVMILGGLNQEVLVPALSGPLLKVERDTRKVGKRAFHRSLVRDRTGRLFLMESYDPKTPLPTLKDVRITWQDAAGVQHRKIAARAFTASLAHESPTWHMEKVRHFNGVEWEHVPTEPFTSAATTRLIKEYEGSAERRNVPLLAEDSGTPSPRLYKFGAYTSPSEFWPVVRYIDVGLETQTTLLRAEMMVWVGDRWLLFGARRYGQTDRTTGWRPEEQLPDGTPLETVLQPADIERAGEFKRASAMMTLGELADIGARFPGHRIASRCLIIFWNRIAFLLANVALVLLTVPVAFRQSTHTALLGIALAVLITLLYTVANFVSIDLGYRRWFIWQFPLFAGVFPTLLFAVIGVWLFSKMDDV